MTVIYETLGAFYRAYREQKNIVITMDDVEDLLREVRKENHAHIHKDGSVVVIPYQEYSYKYPAQKQYYQKKYTKLSASLDRGLVAAFSEACSALGVTQASVLTPLIEDTIRKATL